ncbi:hypothetical protein ACFE04_024075 [Oxalis oulophora]
MSLDSKRSFNSNSSSTNNNNKRSKRSSNQQTLGMAWASNSPKSSPFSDFSSYMVVKNRKLRSQFDAEVSNNSNTDSTSAKCIFNGVSIFVDGFTIPSSQELRGYMLNYGGRFEHYFSKTRVTHIICSNLPDSKVKNLRAFSRGLPVVKPTWILDCIAANRLLSCNVLTPISWVPYQLDQLANNQPKLSDFFSSKGNALCVEDLNDVTCQVKPTITDPSLKGGTLRDTNSSEAGDRVNNVNQINWNLDDLAVAKNSDAMTIEDPSKSSGKSWEYEISKHDKKSITDEGNLLTENQSFPGQPPAPVSSYCSDVQRVKMSPSTASGTSKQCHSTLQDPNFVENYFKSSRLHFIGTWRNRYRKRFQALSNGFKCSASNLDLDYLTCKWKAIIHVDLDCFFVSVVIRKRPELQDKPVAVCHSDSPNGTSEISSANYPARDYGVKAGMFVRDAKTLCPHLVIIPYDFEAYEEVADQFYDILHKHCNKVQAVSCDEAFLDVTEVQGKDPEVLASAIRKEIFDTTGCTASAGISGNMLMARLATTTAKPNGQCCIPQQKVDEYLNELPIKKLPGIGHVLEEKLKLRNVRTCGQLRMLSKMIYANSLEENKNMVQDSLQKDFGTKTSEMLWNYCRGVDSRLVGMVQESKSIGAEVNWGVRFRDLQHSQNFLFNLCKEVSLRLQGYGARGRTFTLKIKKRRKDAPEPSKYMGCGDCENLSHSVTVPIATDDVEAIQRMTKQLFGSFHVDVKEIRGIGLQVSKLENADTSNKGVERNSLKSWLMSASASTEQCKSNDVANNIVSTACLCHLAASKCHWFTTNIVHCTDLKGKRIIGSSSSCQMDNNPSNEEGLRVMGLPPLSHLDMEVLESLPPELFSELNETYGGKLEDFVNKKKRKTENVGNSSCTVPQEQLQGTTMMGNCSSSPDVGRASRKSSESKAMQNTATEIPQTSVSAMGSCSETSRKVVIGRDNLLSSSLNDVDASVLQQLAEEVRELLPTNNQKECRAIVGSSPPVETEKPMDYRITEVKSGSINCDKLWIGEPPQWVDKFKTSDFLILNHFAKLYYKAGPGHYLSSILQRMVSESFDLWETSCHGWDEAVQSFSELLKQFIKLQIETNLEEIYVCFRILRRLMSKSKFFSEVYNIVLPYLQAFVKETYRGNLELS